MNQSQKYPKLMIVSNGKRTAALLDGAFLGKQIPKMEFVADGNDVRLRLVDIDVDSFRMERGADAFEEAVREFAEPEASPLDGIKQAFAEVMASYGRENVKPIVLHLDTKELARVTVRRRRADKQ